MASESDRLLVRSIRAGDSGAWEQLVGRYEGRLTAFAVRKIHDRISAEDIVQETFLGFLNSLPNYDENRELQTYLFTICAYKITDHLRKQGRRPVRTGDSAEEEMMVKADSDQRPASSLARSREQRDQEAAALARALSRMIEAWKSKNEYARIQVLELLFVKGWGNQEVAAFLKLNEQQIANYRFAAIKKLGEQLREAGLPTDLIPKGE